jgi:hypothetical protein
MASTKCITSIIFNVEKSLLWLRFNSQDSFVAPSRAEKSICMENKKQTMGTCPKPLLVPKNFVWIVISLLQPYLSMHIVYSSPFVFYLISVNSEPPAYSHIHSFTALSAHSLLWKAVQLNHLECRLCSQNAWVQIPVVPLNNWASLEKLTKCFNFSIPIGDIGKKSGPVSQDCCEDQTSEHMGTHGVFGW